MMKLVRYILMALVATVLTTSCIKDDLDECHNVTIYSSIWLTAIRTY